MASFFFDKKALATGRLPRSLVPAHTRIMRPPVLIAREILGPKAGRRTEHLVTVDVNTVPMTRHGFFFVWRHNCRAPGRQTQDQSSIGCDTCDATAHRTSAALL